MPRRGLKVMLLAVLTLVLVAGFAGVAQAQWSDLTLSIVGDYGITEAQVGQISQGFPDGTWKPYMAMPRKQFVKMAVDAYKIPLVNPATPTYSDVAKTDYYYQWIEAATAAGLTNGIGGGKFDPNGTITREQAAKIIAVWVAQKNGFIPAGSDDFGSVYTDGEADAILADFPDADQVGPSIKKAMAFAVDMGIVWGTRDGKLNPKGTLLRIQGAAMLIRSWAIVPTTPPAQPPAKIELVGDDKAENLIGQAHTYTFLVTDAAGDPVANALVDFDTIMAAWYVGNVQPGAVLTNEDGEATVNLLATEVGTQRVTAAVNGVAAVYATKYWLALDEVYILDATREAQNNVNTPHTWTARVVVFGPGPLSTSAQDWYNAVKPDANPAAPLALDAVDWPLGWAVAILKEFYTGVLPLPGWEDWDDWSDLEAWVEDATGMDLGDLEDLPAEMSTWDVFTLINTLLATDRFTFASEQLMAELGYMPRTLEGIPVTWSIEDIDEDTESVGEITASRSTTDASGTVSVTINSTATGQTLVSVVADYPGNPYPAKLFDHLTNQGFGHFLDWDDQPMRQATAIKTWIPHTIGGDGGPITPQPLELNIGEQQVLTVTLADEFGNPITGRQVEWFMQGIGHFVTDDENTITDPLNPAGNIDLDTTDASGTARVFVKSLDAGEQIVHAKVRDKGTGGNEGAFITYTAEVQWFDVNVATFDDPTTVDNEAVAENPVGTDHQFCITVYGLKLELDPTIDEPAHQTNWVDTDAAGASYDGVLDARDAAYLGGILLVNPDRDLNWEDHDNFVNGDPDNWVTIKDGKVVKNLHPYTEPVAGGEITLSLIGGYTEYDWNQDGIKETFTGDTGIYLPLEGKTVTFEIVDSDLLDFSEVDAQPDGLATGIDSVGAITTEEEVVTDENGVACVTISSDEKGPTTVMATVDWEGNPHNGPQLITAFAKKTWQASGACPDVEISVTMDGVEVAHKAIGDANLRRVNGGGVTNPIIDADNPLGLSSAHIEVHVLDAFGNELPDFEVVYLLENVDTIVETGGQGAIDTYLPLAEFRDLDDTNTVDEVDYDLNGGLPDSDEPAPESDPFANIVGDGGTPAFFFNQWLGSDRPIDNLDDLETALGYTPFWVDWSERIVDGTFLDYVDEDGRLIFDGAKAWTLDGFTLLNGELVPNELTGSNIDVQLLEDPSLGENELLHFKSIVKIEVYAPADGMVIDQAPCAWVEVHKVWSDEELELTSVVLEQMDPATVNNPEPTWTQTGLNITAGTDIQLRVLMLDQFGNAMPDTQFLDAKLKAGSTIVAPLNDTTDADGYLYFVYTPTTTGSLTFQAWDDADGDNLIDAAEVKSNVKTDTIQAASTGTVTNND